MKTTITLLTLLVSTTAQAAFKEKKNLPKTPETIELDTNNTVVLRGEVNESSVGSVIKGIENINSDIVYLYLDTPGGSVFAGMQLVSYIRASPKKVVAVVNTAISMGFVILQAADERIGTESSLAMQHTVSYGIRPQPAPNAVSFQRFLERSTELMDRAQSKRIGISYVDFKQKTRSDWWTYGQDVIDANIVDRSATVTCTKRAMNAEIEDTKLTAFGPLVVTWSGCPILGAPLKVDAKKFFGGTQLEFEIIQSLDVKTTALKDYK